MRSQIRKRRRNKTEVSQELELMPMLNVFISIIPLLLLSAAFVQLAVIPTTLPAVAPPVVVPKDEATVSLTIVIQSGAYVVQVNGATTHSIPRPATTQHDIPSAVAARAQLGEALKAAVAGHTGQRAVRIAADPVTRYEDIIDVMDVSRAAGLPEAALSDAAEGAY